MALAAVWPVPGFCEDAVAVAASARSMPAAVLVTVMVTVDGVLLVTCPSLTTSWKVRVAGWPER